MHFPGFAFLRSGYFKQYLATYIASISLIVSGTAIAWPSPVLPNLYDDDPFTVSHDEASWMVSLLYIGNCISPIPTGYLMDKFGRKMCLLVFNIIPLVSWLIILFVQSVDGLYAARFLIGLWVGISYTIIPIYLGELAQPAIRGSISTTFQTMIYVGVLWEYVLGPFVSYNVLVYLSIIFPIAFLLLFPWIPETPYYYLMKQNTKAAEASLRWFRDPGSNTDEELQQINGYVLLQKQKKQNLKETLFSKAIIKAFVIVSVLSILQRFSGIGTMMAYGSTTLPDKGIEHLNANDCVIVLSVTWITVGILSAFLADKFGRKLLLVISSTGATVSTLLCGVWFYYNPDNDADISLGWAPFTCFMLYGASYGIGLGPSVTTIKGEIFPSHVKGLASGVTTIIMAVSSFGVNRMYIPIKDSVGMYVNFFVYAVISFLTIVFTLTFVIETKGKTLEQIQTKLNKQKPAVTVSLVRNVYKSTDEV